jgi:hypothetical protein
MKRVSMFSRRSKSDLLFVHDSNRNLARLGAHCGIAGWWSLRPAVIDFDGFTNLLALLLAPRAEAARS